LIEGRDLDRSQAQSALADVLAGAAGEARIAALVTGLAAKGETVEELTGMVAAMQAASEPLRLPPAATDIVGTGGSAHRRAHALNVSTMASLVAAAAGATICKHGNRRASSTSGSFDFLEALGVTIDLSPEAVETCVADVGVGFAFARAFHPAMRFAGPVRAALGVPTVFNVLGPLAHPGRVTRQVVGVASPERARDVAAVLHELGSEAAWVVAGAGGLDELSTAGSNQVWSVNASGVTEFVVDPADHGLDRVDPAAIAGGDPAANVALFDQIMAGDPGPHRDIVVLNAAAGLVVGGQADDLDAGLAAARAAIDDGRLATTVGRLRELSGRLAAS
jgi:anthranilate phosphoribosyltransferase